MIYAKISYELILQKKFTESIIIYDIVLYHLCIRFILLFPVNDCTRFRQHVHQISIGFRQYFLAIGQNFPHYCFIRFRQIPLYLCIRYRHQFPVNDRIRLGQHVHPISIRFRQLYLANWYIRQIFPSYCFTRLRSIHPICVSGADDKEKKGEGQVKRWHRSVNQIRQFQPNWFIRQNFPPYCLIRFRQFPLYNCIRFRQQFHRTSFIRLNFPP